MTRTPVFPRTAAGHRAARRPRAFAPVAAALAVAVLLPTSAAAQSEGPALEVLEAAAERYRSFRSLCVDFHQTLSVPLLDQERESRGRICQKQPDLFLMRFTEPGGDVVVADGEWLWVYYPSADPGQVIRMPLAAAGGRFDFHREFLESPDEKYDASLAGRERVDGRAADVVVLTPRRSSAYRSARVWIDRGSRALLRVEIRQENGSIRDVRLSGQEVNPSLADSLFRFEPPEGVQVITRPAS